MSNEGRQLEWIKSGYVSFEIKPFKAIINFTYYSLVSVLETQTPWILF